MRQEKDASLGLWYAIGGAVIGTVLGLLFAPKKGRELREDIGKWGRKGRDKSATLAGRLGAMLPLRVKAAAALGAVKAGGAEAIEVAKESFGLDGTERTP